jgi:hypothetical protein
VIDRQGAGGNQTVQMKMIFESLIPGMKHGGNSHRCAKAPLAKLKQRFTDGFKQKS